MPAGNPLANLFVILAGALIIAGAVVLGFVAFVVLGTVIAILAATIGLRLWWFNRKLRKQGVGTGQRPPPQNVTYIEGEYKVVDKDRDDSPRD